MYNTLATGGISLGIVFNKQLPDIIIYLNMSFKRSGAKRAFIDFLPNFCMPNLEIERKLNDKHAAEIYLKRFWSIYMYRR